MLLSKLTTLLNHSLTIIQAKQVHALVLIYGLTELEPLLVHKILISEKNYLRSTSQYVQLVLHHTPHPDVFSVACTIRFLSHHCQFKDAFNLYVHMQRWGLCPSTFAASSALKACARIRHKKGGVSIHTQVYKYGLGGIVYVQTALMDFYSKLGTMETARRVFDEITGKNVVSWNSILSGYLKSGYLAMARSLFDEMPEKDVISWNSMVSGYAKVGDMDQAYFLFQEMPERNSASWNSVISGYVDCGKTELARSFFDAMPQRNTVSCITMISGYSKRGDVESARRIFDQMGEKDKVLYNAMIACYAQNSQHKEAHKLFNEMLHPNVNIQPDKMTFASVISACAQLGDLRYGPWIESYIHQFGIELDDHLITAFIDFYSKCGDTDKAYKLFCRLQKKDLVAYTAMILGYGINGKANDAIKLFEEMMAAEINPNLATITGLLTAYNHVGLVEEGYHCFKSMGKYGLAPSGDHYGIMVDLLGRAGRLVEAHELLKSMPMRPDIEAWGALLLACSLHNNVEIGEVAARHCFELVPDTKAYRSLLVNIYASAGRWDDAERLRKDMAEKDISEIPGCSWMDNS